MSSWRWKMRAHFGEGLESSDRVAGSVDDVYRLAADAIERGAASVAVLLFTPDSASWAVADSCDPASGKPWVVGLDEWRENEREAIEEGRA